MVLCGFFWLVMQGFVNPFAVDITFDQCEKAISGRREFRVTVKGRIKESLLFFHDLKPFQGEYRVVNYDFCFGATFPDPNEAATEEERQLLRVRRECRGLVFDKNGALVARRLHKFFGLNQLPETSSVRLEGSCVVVEKLDGSMISAMMGPDEAVLLLSKNGPTELSSRIELAMAKNQSGWKELCIKWLKMGWTPTFEWMDPEQPVVLVYPKQELSLIAIRNISTGLYLTQTALEAEAKAFGVAVAPTLWNSAKDGPLDLDGLKERVKLAKDTEGCILKLEDQQLFVKLKSDWYFEQSKSSMKLPNKERDVWKMVRCMVQSPDFFFFFLVDSVSFVRFWRARWMICFLSSRWKCVERWKNLQNSSLRFAFRKQLLD